MSCRIVGSMSRRYTSGSGNARASSARSGSDARTASPATNAATLRARRAGRRRRTRPRMARRGSPATIELASLRSRGIFHRSLRRGRLWIHRDGFVTPSEPGMPSTAFDSAIFRDTFAAPAMRAVFSDESAVRRWVEVEVALAAAEARVGVIPAEAAQAIRQGARPEDIDLAQLKAETDLVGYPIVGLVHQLAKQVGEAGRYVHWGATTQDIMDTAAVLQIKEALGLVEADVAAIDAALARLADKHRRAVMAGRTHLQHALPVT